MTQRDRIVISVLGVVAVLAGYWFLALKPQRAELKKVEAEVTQQRDRLDSAMAKVTAGEEARRGFAKDYATVARLGKAVPVDDQVPSLVYQLQSASEKSDVDFRALKLRAEGAVAAPTATPVTSGGKVPATQAAAAVAPPGSAVGPAGFPSMPFSFAFEGDFFDMERMLSRIERFTGTVSSDGEVKADGRLLTIDGVGIKKSRMNDWPYIETSVMATAYVLPPEEGVFGAVEPGADAAAGGDAPTQNAGTPSEGPRPATATAGGIVP